MTDSEYWGRYYAVTAERPAWATVRRAIELFDAEPSDGPRLAVDLGCGAGRDARALLAAGWRVLAVDREPAAIAALEAATPIDRRGLLETRVGDLATVDIPRCDLVNASVSLPFLAPEQYWSTWRRIVAALSGGGRIAAMLYADRDQLAVDPGTTCPSSDELRAALAGFDIEHWTEREEESRTALGEPHHLHLVELVARARAGDRRATGQRDPGRSRRSRSHRCAPSTIAHRPRAAGRLADRLIPAERATELAPAEGRLPSGPEPLGRLLEPKPRSASANGPGIRSECRALTLRGAEGCRRRRS